MIEQPFLKILIRTFSGWQNFHAGRRERKKKEREREREVNFPITAGWTPNKQFCFSKSEPIWILSPHSKPWYHICSQVVK